MFERITKTVSAEVHAHTDGSFEGYASTFGNRDHAGDVIVPGAFTKTLADNGLPKLFLGHDWSLTIGKIEHAQEDSKGLYISGRLNLAQTIGKDTYEAFKAGEMDSFSIGGMVAHSDMERTAEGRTIKSWTKLVEVSAVAVPCNDEARLTAVKSLDGIETIRDLEQFLREGGLSRSTVQALIAKSRDLFHTEAEDEKANAIAARIGAMLV